MHHISYIPKKKYIAPNACFEVMEEEYGLMVSGDNQDTEEKKGDDDGKFAKQGDFIFDSDFDEEINGAADGELVW